MRKHDRPVQVVAIARENRALERSEAVLRHRADVAGSEACAGHLLPAWEYARIKRAVLTGDTTVLDTYGGVKGALKRAIELQSVAQERSFQVVIDGYRTWHATRLLRTPFGCA